MGVAGLALSGAFWGFVYSNVGPNDFTRSPYVVFVLLPGILLLAALVFVAASLLGSKWWLTALISPVAGAILLLTASV